MKLATLFALFVAAVFAAETSIAQDEAAKIEAGCPCRKPETPRVCRSSSSSSNNFCPRTRGCGCPSSSSSDACCKPVYCPRHPVSSSTSELPTAGCDSSSEIVCRCCEESSSNCGFLRAPHNVGWVDRRCECSPCNCDPCAGRRDDGCGCN